MKTSSINLAALKHAVIVNHGKNKDVPCVVIPIEPNHLYKSDKGGLYLNLIHFEMKEEKEYGTHIIKQSLPKEVREAMSDEEKNAMPILGNSKFGEYTPNNEASAPVIGSDDDLPF